MAQDATTKPTTPPATAAPADVVNVDAIMLAVYDVISGPAGDRDWDRFRSLFTPDARLIPVNVGQDGSVRPTYLTIDNYVKNAGGYFRTNGFFEREIHRVTEEYGHMVHVFSTYESRHKADDAEPFSRGINSFQLMNDGNRWWVINIYWDSERPDQPIPAKYLPNN